MTFHDFSEKINQQFESMAASQPLFITAIDKETIWNTYLSSFIPEANPIYLERTEHDCQMCKQFIRHIGNVITINDDDSYTSIWDVPGITAPYDQVAAALSENVKSHPIQNIFLHNEPKAGRKTTVQQLPDNQVKTWSHFYADIPNKFYERDIATKKGKAQSSTAVHLRSLNEITMDAINTVLDLINDNAIYRGAEFKTRVEKFKTTLEKFQASTNHEAFAWKTFKLPGSGIRNTVIGSLLTDLSDNKDLEASVASYEAKVAPANYKRPKKVVTKRMMEEAIKTIDKLGIRDSLPRRHAISTDVSVNDVLFADRGTAMKDQDPLMELMNTKESVSIKFFKNALKLPIDKFISEILPNTTSLSLAITPQHKTNEIYISAPVNTDAPNILQWDNNFSWSYNGNVADSDIAQNVAAKGGKIDGVLRFSIQWNENNQDNTDLDAHCQTPYDHISYSNKQCYKTKGTLDIDIINPKHKVAVENITWASMDTLRDGDYKFWTHDYAGQGIRDIHKAEIAFNGELYQYSFNGMSSRNQQIATVTVKNGQFSIKHHAPCSEASTAELVPIKMSMLSPNYWENNQSGNKHYIFITDSVVPTNPFRGFYNEFISPALHDNRKVFDLLSTKMMCEPVENGLSGYGFSSTKTTKLFVKADSKVYQLKI